MNKLPILLLILLMISCSNNNADIKNSILNYKGKWRGNLKMVSSSESENSNGSLSDNLEVYFIIKEDGTINDSKEVENIADNTYKAIIKTNNDDFHNEVIINFTDDMNADIKITVNDTKSSALYIYEGNISKSYSEE